MQVRFNNDGCFIEKGDHVVAHGHREGCIFILESSEVKLAMYAKSQKVKTDLKLWHKRIGHINLQKLQNMQSKIVTVKEMMGVCEACHFGKQNSHKFPKEQNVSKGILDAIHLDVWGPAQTTTFGGCRYYVTFIDNFSRNTWIYPMK